MKFSVFPKFTACDFKDPPGIFEPFFHAAAKRRCETTSNLLITPTAMNEDIVFIEPELGIADGTFCPLDLILTLHLNGSVDLVCSEQKPTAWAGYSPALADN
jgi:hypothetical protein